MPISTRPAKSGMKKVFKAKRSNLKGELNVRARSVSRGDGGDLTPGAVTEVFDRGTTKASQKKQRAILENRRRRH